MNKLNALAPMAALSAFVTSGALAAPEPNGVWIDHTGRGAVEIVECSGGGLCGYVVWVKDAKNNKACRTQIIGNVRPVGGNTWDRGWIIDPDDDSKYSVELKPIGEDRLRVVGYMGSKMFSETMTWRRAPADLKRCDGKEATAPAAAPVAAPPVAPPAAPAVTRPAPAAAPVPREAAAPVAPLPPPMPAPSTAPAPEEPRVAPSAAPAPRPRVATAETPPPAAEDPAPRTPGVKRKPAGRECTLDLSYIKLKYPCDALDLDDDDDD